MPFENIQDISGIHIYIINFQNVKKELADPGLEFFKIKKLILGGKNKLRDVGWGVASLAYHLIR